jgi:hypothetical protein
MYSLNLTCSRLPFGELVQCHDSPIIASIVHLDNTGGTALEVALQHPADDINTISLVDENWPFLALVMDIEAIGIFVVVAITGLGGDECDVGSDSCTLRATADQPHTFNCTAMDE